MGELAGEHSAPLVDPTITELPADCPNRVERAWTPLMVKAKNTAAVRVGRLLELRLSVGFRNVTFVTEIFAAMDAEIRRLPSDVPVVIAADWRRCRVMSSDASESLVANLSRYNTRVERSGAIASEDSPSAVLQFTRLIREAAHPDRRLFTDPEAMASWLGEVLAPDERRRLAEFLAESGDELKLP